MPFDIDQASKAAGDKHKYQYIVLPIVFLTWFSCDFVAISLPFLKQEPEAFKCRDVGSSLIDCTKEEACNADYFETASKYTSYFEESRLFCIANPVMLSGLSLAIGCIVGALLFSKLIDTLGRKRALVVANIIFSLSLFPMMFCNRVGYLNFFYLLIIGISSTGGTVGAYMYLSETVGSDLRSIFGNILNSSFAFAGYLYFGIYQFSFYWRYSAILGLLSSILCMILTVALLEESARYYSKEGNLTKASVVLFRIAKVNNRQKEYLEYVNEALEGGLEKGDTSIDDSLNESPVEGLISTVSVNEFEQQVSRLFNSQNEEETVISFQDDKFTFGQLFTVPIIRRFVLQTCALWGLSIFVYYGITFALDQLIPNIFTGAYVNYGAEAVSYFVTASLYEVKGYGRVTNYKLMFFISALFCLPRIFFSSGILDYVCLFAVRFSIVSVYSNCFLYSMELFPSEARSKALGLNNMVARLTLTIMAGMVEFLDKHVLFTAFTIMSVLGFFVSVTLRETKDKKMVDKVDEIDNN